MEYLPTFLINISNSLSDVLDALGLDMETIRKKREIYLKTEQMWTKMSTEQSVTVHHFGSQTEGTTTMGLNSDLDSLTCFDASNITDSIGYWKKGRLNLLIEKDDKSAPGYCRLRCLRNDKADFESVENISDESYVNDGINVYLKNTYILNITEKICTAKHFPFIKKGPSGSGTDKIDFVTAFRYNGEKDDNVKFIHTRPWPPTGLRDKAFSCDHFIVPVGHPRSDCEYAEWRISSSMTERILMFSLNETQIKAYVIIKMMKENFFKRNVGEAITSYHCKNALFYTIANSNNDLWRPHNLCACIIQILNTLLSFYKNRFCPQFVNPTVNLFDGKAGYSKCIKMTDLIKNVIENDLKLLLDIDIDDVGTRLSNKFMPMVQMITNGVVWRPVVYEKHLGITTIEGKAWRNWLLLHFVFVTEFTRASGSYIAKYIIELHHNGFRVYTNEPEQHSNLDVVEKFTKIQRKIPWAVKQLFKQIVNIQGLHKTTDVIGNQQERHLVTRTFKNYYVKPVSQIEEAELDLESILERQDTCWSPQVKHQ